MTEYLINLSPNQIGYPKTLFSPKKVISDYKEDNPIKKSKTYAYDDSKINSSEEKLSPELIDYLKSIAPESDEDEDQGTKKSYPNHTQSRRSNFQEMETSSDEDIDKTHQKKRRNKDNNKQYMSILTRLTSANPSFVWKISETGPLKSYYLTIFKLSIKWALITDPYNPRARRTGGLPKHLDIVDPEVVEENINFKQVLWLRKPISELVKDDEISGETLKRLLATTPSINSLNK